MINAASSTPVSSSKTVKKVVLWSSQSHLSSHYRIRLRRRAQCSISQAMRLLHTTNLILEELAIRIDHSMPYSLIPEEKEKSLCRI